MAYLLLEGIQLKKSKYLVLAKENAHLAFSQSFAFSVHHTFSTCFGPIFYERLFSFFLYSVHLQVATGHSLILLHLGG